MKLLNQKSKTPSEQYTLESKSRGFTKRRRYSETLYVLGDSLSDTVDQVRATTGVPKLYEEKDGCYCVGVNPQEVATIISPLTGQPCSLWEVSVQWDSDVGTDSSPGEGSGGDSSTPDQRPPQYRWTSEKEETYPIKDLTGKVIATPTGEPIVLVRKRTIPVLEIRRNEIFPFDPQIILDYQNTSNKSSFWGAPAYSALMDSIDTDFPFVENGVVYVPVTYRIMFKTIKQIDTSDPDYNWMDPDTWKTILTPDNPLGSWQDEVLCKGLYYYDKTEYDTWVAGGSLIGSKPKPRLYAEGETQWNAKEVFLEAATGKILADQTNPESLYFVNVVTKDWSTLNLQPWWWTSSTTTTT